MDTLQQKIERLDALRRRHYQLECTDAQYACSGRMSAVFDQIRRLENEIEDATKASGGAAG